MSFSTIQDRIFRPDERRRCPRVANQALFAIIDGRVYPVGDWSIGGFRLDDYPRSVTEGERIVGELAIETDADVEAAFTAEVAWTDARGSVGLRIMSLDDMPKAFEGDES